MNELEEQCNLETHQHITKVVQAMVHMVAQISHRAAGHDRSKFSDHERPHFAKATHLLKDLEYGSPEYTNILETVLKPALEHHYRVNRHHPEYYPKCETEKSNSLREDIEGLSAFIELANPESQKNYISLLKRVREKLEEDLEVEESRVNNMTILDVLEMLCDWWAAGQRHTTGNIARSIEINTKRFALSNQLRQILLNSVGELPYTDSDVIKMNLHRDREGRLRPAKEKV